LRLLSRLTHGYKDEREAANIVDAPLIEELPAPLMRGFAGLMGGQDGGWKIERYGRVGSYSMIGLALRKAIFADDAPRRLFARTKLDCFFASAVPEEGRIDLYLPRLSEARIALIVSGIASVITPLSGSEPREAYAEGSARPDGLFLPGTALPREMRLPDLT
jgi:hypothetical protein